MRGIAAIIHWDGALVDSVDLQRIMCAMRICPSDRLQQFNGSTAAFAHFVRFFYREDRFEDQPLRSSDGNIILITDAVLDNREELACQFNWPIHEAQSLPDSAFVLSAYERWGASCTSRLEGKYAFAAWHVRQRRLFCAVDHFGYRPLYYWRSGTEIVLATTLRGLFALPRISRHINEDVFAAHVARIDPADPAATLYRDVNRIPAGHQLTIDDKGATIDRHWNPDATRVLQLGSDAEYQEAFATELERAVRTSLRRSPREIGLMVSGGLDSSAIVAVAGKVLAAEGRRLHAFHFVPGETLTDGALRELDESRFAKALQRHAPHIDFHFLPNRLEPLMPPKWDSVFDDDFVPFRVIPAQANLILQQALDEYQIGTLLNGSGGNFLVSLESFSSGYLTHLFATGKWQTWLQEAVGLRQVYGKSLWRIFRQTVLAPVKRSLLPRRDARITSPVLLLNPALRQRTRVEADLRYQAAVWQRLPLDFRGTLRDVLTEASVDKGAVSQSVIRRGSTAIVGAAPMSDRRFNEFCLSLPFDQQIRSGWDRRLLRETMRGLLPEDVRLRITRGFPQPGFRSLFSKSEAMLRSEFERISSASAAAQYLDVAWLQMLMNLGRNSPEKSRRIWTEGIVLSRFLEWHSNR